MGLPDESLGVTDEMKDRVASLRAEQEALVRPLVRPSFEATKKQQPLLLLLRAMSGTLHRKCQDSI